MRILFIGDIVGKPGRDIVVRATASLVKEEKLDLVVANAENSAGGSGLTPDNQLDLLDLDEALKKLSALDPRGSRVVELRFFGGLSVEDSAHVLGVSTRTVEGDWHMAKAWLRRQLGG